MTVSNSPLISYTKISPNRGNIVNDVWAYNRTHKIDTITIHCVVGQLSVQGIGNCFASSSAQASSNYGIGYDGQIGMYVEEKDRSWCSSNGANDNRAITIECASDKTHPYAINKKVYKSLINLCVDICKRNDIKELKWKADKSLVGKVDQQNMTVHRWFANKSCPGDYIYNRLGQIASEVNAKLNSIASNSKPTTGTIYRVRAGAFRTKANANNRVSKLKIAGFDSFIVQTNGLYKVQAGAFSTKSKANAMVSKLKAAGFEAYVTTKD